MTALNEDFFDLLSALIREHADFLVVGAHALAVHGVPRATGDLDVLVRSDSQNAARVVAALESFGAPLEAWTSESWWRRSPTGSVVSPTRKRQLAKRRL